MSERATILFLCTGNSARSIMAEAIERFANSSGEIDQRGKQVAGFVPKRFGHVKTV